MGPVSTPARVWAVALAILGTAVALAFVPALSGGLVWDDGPNIVHNSRLRHLDGELLEWAFTETLLGHYQPLTWISLAIDRAIGGGRAYPFHLTSLILHVLNTLLFAVVARRLFERVAGRDGSVASGWPAIAAWVSAAVFGLHPMRAESVAWATERRDVLSAAFFLIALAAYLRWEREAPPRPRFWFAVSLAAFGSSLLSKALGLALPVVLLVLDLYPLSRWKRWKNGSNLGRLVLEKVPYLLLAFVFGLIALAAQAEAGALVPLSRYGVLQRAAQICYSIAFYPRTIFAAGWSALYERPYRLDPAEPRFLISVLAVLLVTALAILGRRRFPAGLAAWVCYLALLAPVTGLAQSGIQLVADRYSYLAGLPWAMLLGAGFATAWRRWPRREVRAALALALAGGLGIWAAATWNHSRSWHDDETLWRRVVAHGPSAMAYNNLGRLAFESGRTEEALPLYRQALEVAPTFPLAWRNLRALFEQSGGRVGREELARVIRALEEGLPGQGDSAEARYILGLAYLEAGRGDDALARFREVVERKPGDAEAWKRIGTILMVRGSFVEAAAAFARAVELRPLDSASWTGLGICRAAIGDGAAAREAFRRALRIDPGDARARSQLRRLEASGALR